MAALLLCVMAASETGSTCVSDSAGMGISEYAHATNEAFISKVTSGHGRGFVPSMPLAAIDSAFRISPINLETERFLTYVSDNGWNNQLLNLLCAIDMARLTNRTLIVPVFQWPRRRGSAKVSVARLIDLGSLARLGVRVICEDEAGSVAAALAATPTRVIHGEGQPHRKRRMPRWSRDDWVRTAGVESADRSNVQVTCCLFWTWTLPPDIAREIYAVLRYHPMLEAAARQAAQPLLGAAGGGTYAAMHVRRGDKARVDSAYTAIFGGKMSTSFFARLARDEGFERGATVFVATDELDRSWFRPLADASSYTLTFAEDLDQRALLEALSAFPQALWADVLAILEQIVCINAQGGFVGSLPSTLSGHVVNARATRSMTAGGDSRPLFTKLHESCCDARTALDLLKLPEVQTLEQVPCVAAVEGC